MAATPQSQPPRAVRIDSSVAVLSQRMAAVRTEIGKAIIGQDEVVEQALITILSGGHGLLIGLPGLGKSRLVETMGTVLGLNSKRIQFTPDLMPADIVGSEVLDEVDGRRVFRFIEGPVFCELLMADEINRASPRTQSALLQAMQEQRVSIAGADRALSQPFHVLATQNPIEQEGTYPLPEAQLDRFLMAINVPYPDEASETAMLLATTGGRTQTAARVMNKDDLLAARALIREIDVSEKVLAAIVGIVRRGRPESTDLEIVRRHVGWGPGPRAGQALMLACRARAILRGDTFPSLDDVRALLGPVLRHRMALNFSARADGIVLDDVIAGLGGGIV